MLQKRIKKLIIAPQINNPEKAKMQKYALQLTTTNSVPKKAEKAKKSSAAHDRHFCLKNNKNSNLSSIVYDYHLCSKLAEKTHMIFLNDFQKFWKSKYLPPAYYG